MIDVPTMAATSYSAALMSCFLLCSASMPRAIVLSPSSHTPRASSTREPASIKEQPDISSKPALIAPRGGGIGLHAAGVERALVAEYTNKHHTSKKDHFRRARETWLIRPWGREDSHSKTNTSSRVASPPPGPDTSMNNAIPPVPPNGLDHIGHLTSTTPATDLVNSAHGSVDSNEITDTGGVRFSTNMSRLSNAGSDVQPLGQRDDHADTAENDADKVGGGIAQDNGSKESTADTGDGVTAATSDLTKYVKDKDNNFTGGVSQTAVDSSTDGAGQLLGDTNKRLVNSSFGQGSAQSQQGSAQSQQGSAQWQHGPAQSQQSPKGVKRQDTGTPPHGESVVQDADLAPVLKTPTSAKNRSGTPSVLLPRVGKPKVPKRPGDSSHVGATQQVDGGGSFNATRLSLTLRSQEDSVTVLWTFESNDTRITGFLVTYRINNREHYDSSKLGKLVRSFTLHSLHEDEDYVICVHAMVNTTAVMDACAHWNEASMKMVVGIMAGTLFLVPCIVVIIWILIKDGQMRNKMTKDVEKGGVAYKKRLITHDGSLNDAHCHGRHDGSLNDTHCHGRHDGSLNDTHCHGRHDGFLNDTHCHAPHSDLEVSNLSVNEGTRKSHSKGLLGDASSSPSYNRHQTAVNFKNDSGPWKRQSQAESQEVYSHSPGPETDVHSSTLSENHSSRNRKPSSPKLHQHGVENACADLNTSTVCASDSNDTPIGGVKPPGASHSSGDLPRSAGSSQNPTDRRRLSEPWYAMLDHENVIQGNSCLHIPPVLCADHVTGKGQGGDMVAPL